MTQARSRSYSEYTRPSETSYVPIPNSSLVKAANGIIPPEYRQILPYTSTAEKIGERVLHIVSDVVIELDGHQAELGGDTRFILNALLADREKDQLLIDLANFGSGFRGRHYRSMSTTQSTPLQRPIKALDAFSRDATGDILIGRTAWGSGTIPGYRLKEDIDVTDARIPQQRQ
jgi:hypothetical protein